MAKPTRASVLAFGLPPPAAASPPSLVDRVDETRGLLFARAHGLEDGDTLSFQLNTVTTLGAQPGALPTVLLEGTTYEAEPATSDAFRVRPQGGATITSFADAGVGRFSFLVDPWAALDAAIDKAWRVVLAMCVAHKGDITADIVTDAAAALAVRFYVAHMAAGDPDKGASYDGLAALWADTYKPLLDSYLAGAPVKDAVDDTPAKAEMGARLVELADAEPFDLCGGRA